jgi:hypothetical protein
MAADAAATAAAAVPRADADDTKKNQKDKWRNFFSPSNPDLWIALGVIALVIILVGHQSQLQAR